MLTERDTHGERWCSRSVLPRREIDQTKHCWGCWTAPGLTWRIMIGAVHLFAENARSTEAAELPAIFIADEDLFRANYIRSNVGIVRPYGRPETLWTP
jgi:hypothetical protein